MNIKYTQAWLMSGTETIIEISDNHITKGIRNVLKLDTWPKQQLYELPNNDRLNSLISGIKDLRDGEIEKLGALNRAPQILSISGIGYFKWYSENLPEEWRALQNLVRYLRHITRNINTREPNIKQEFEAHVNQGYDSYIQFNQIHCG